jgi:hypothetical protein
MNIPGSENTGSHREDLGYPTAFDNHLTQQEACCILHTEAREQIRRFVQAMNLTNPPSDDDAATLLMNITKRILPPGWEEMAVEMRISNWDRYLSEHELQEAARRAQNFLQTPEGIELGNFFVKTMAKATHYMWADDEPGSSENR